MTLRGIAKYFRLSQHDAEMRVRELVKLGLLTDLNESEYEVRFPGKKKVVKVDVKNLKDWLMFAHQEYDGIITAIGEMCRLGRQMNVSEIARLLGVDMAKAEFIQSRCNGMVERGQLESAKREYDRENISFLKNADDRNFFLRGKGEQLCSMDLFIGYILGMSKVDVEEGFRYIRPKELQGITVRNKLGISADRAREFLDWLYERDWLERRDDIDKAIVKKGEDLLNVLGKDRIIGLFETGRKGIICVDYCIRGGLCGGRNIDVREFLGITKKTTTSILKELESYGKDLLPYW